MSVMYGAEFAAPAAAENVPYDEPLRLPTAVAAATARLPYSCVGGLPMYTVAGACCRPEAGSILVLLQCKACVMVPCGDVTGGAR